MAVRRRALVATAFLGLVAGLPASRAATVAEVAEPIAELNGALIGIMRTAQTVPFARRYAQLAPVVEKVFDLPGILRACVGPRWSSFGTSERNTLMRVFERFTVASYIANFDAYEGERFFIVPELRSIGTGQVVQTQIIPLTGNVSRIDYVMRPFETGWKAVDVLLEGTISHVAVLRSDFRNSIQQGEAAALIADLQRKVADLSGGIPPS